MLMVQFGLDAVSIMIILLRSNIDDKCLARRYCPILADTDMSSLTLKPEKKELY
jgi:hypothetical protein